MATKKGGKKGGGTKTPKSGTKTPKKGGAKKK